MTQKALSMLLGLIIMTSACAGIGIDKSAREAYKQGLAHFNLGRYEKAAAAFEKAIEIEPEYADAYLYLGRSYLNQSMWLEAVPPLRAAFQLAPEESKNEILHVLMDALFGAAMYEFKQGNYRNSAEFLKDVLQLAPESIEAKRELVLSLMALGKNLLADGRASEAIEVFEETIRMAPDNLDAYVGLARSFFKNGDIFKAVRALRDALNIDPSSDEASSLLKKINMF